MVSRLGPGAGIQHREGAEGDEAHGNRGQQQGGDAFGNAPDRNAPLGVHQMLQGHDEK